MLVIELRLLNELSRLIEWGCGNKCVYECRVWLIGINIFVKIVMWYVEGGSDFILVKVIFEKMIYYWEDINIL